MKLDTRRAIRGWLLNRPDGTLFWTGVGALGVAILGLVIRADAVFVAGFLVSFGAVYIDSTVKADSCPTCRSKVNAVGDRYCSTCGARLDDLEAAPPIDERVAERHRPVGLEEIERSPDVETIADGGSYEEADT